MYRVEFYLRVRRACHVDRDEHPRGGACLRAAPGHGAQDVDVLAAPWIPAEPAGGPAQTRPLQRCDRPDPGG